MSVIGFVIKKRKQKVAKMLFIISIVYVIISLGDIVMEPCKALVVFITIVLCSIAFCQDKPEEDADPNRPFIRHHD